MKRPFFAAFIVFILSLTGSHLAHANTPPDAPLSLSQHNSLGGPALSAGATNNNGQVVFEAESISDADSEQAVGLEIELRPVSNAFSNVPTHASPLGMSGLPIKVQTTDLASGAYHWQARAIDADQAASAWVAFGGNPENEPDITVFTEADVANLPDLRFESVSLTPSSLIIVVRNAGLVAVPNPVIRLQLQWLKQNAAGAGWSATGLSRGFDYRAPLNANTTETFTIDGTNPELAGLYATIAAPPAEARRLRIEVDSFHSIIEFDEGNNEITVDRPLPKLAPPSTLPDLAFATSALRTQKPHFQILNQGKARAGAFKIDLEWLDANKVSLAKERMSTRPLSPGGTRTVQFKSVAHAVYLKAKLDALNQVAESDESNNEILIRIFSR